MKKPFIRSWIVLACLGTVCALASAQDRPAAERLRQEAKELMARARELKEDGKMEESEELAGKAKRLAREAEAMSERQKKEKKGEVDRPEDQREKLELKRERDRDRQQAHAPEGRPEAIERGERRVIRREFEIERAPDRDRVHRVPPQPLRERFGGQPPFQGPPRIRRPFDGPGRFAPGPGFRGPRPFGDVRRPMEPLPPGMGVPPAVPRGERPGMPAPMQQMRERREHVLEAIRHLHAAGLHEPAEQIERHFREGMARLEREHAGRPPSVQQRDGDRPDQHREHPPEPRPEHREGDRPPERR